MYTNGDLRYDTATKPGAYRVEVRLAKAPGEIPIPWLVSNAIYVSIGAPGAPTGKAAAPPVAGTIAPFPWRIEKDQASSAIVRTHQSSVDLEYQLAPGDRDSQYVALATDIHNASFSAIRLGLQSGRPSRIWVQVRTQAGLRWGRTYYVDPAGTEVEARLRDLGPLGESPIGAPDPKAVTSILLVIDLTNAVPGQSGWLSVLSSELVN